MDSYRYFQNQQTMIRTCPVHGENSNFKDSLMVMQAQAHSYAFSCFLFFKKMAKLAKSDEERAYYKKQQAISGCMVHGPHGVTPVPLPFPILNSTREEGLMSSSHYKCSQESERVVRD